MIHPKNSLQSNTHFRLQYHIQLQALHGQDLYHKFQKRPQSYTIETLIDEAIRNEQDNYVAYIEARAEAEHENRMIEKYGY